MSLVVRSGTGRGLLAWMTDVGEFVNLSTSSLAGIEDSKAFDIGLLGLSAPCERSLFSAIDWTAFLDFLVPNACVSAAREE